MSQDRRVERSRNPAGAPKARDLSQAEWIVMDAVWSAGAEVTAREVLEATSAQADWAYTTVKTMLDRLVDKGVLSSQRNGKTTHYLPTFGRGKARWAAARNLADRAFDGAFGSLVHFLVRSETLSKADRDELRTMLETIERDEAASGSILGSIQDVPESQAKASGASDDEGEDG